MSSIKIFLDVIILGSVTYIAYMIGRIVELTKHIKEMNKILSRIKRKENNS